MNKPDLTPTDVSRALSELMPNIIRGVQLDFFTNRIITQTQFMMVVAIHSYGRCTMTALAGNLSIKMPTATGIVDRLVRGGYAKRLVDPDDRRQVMVELTPKGLRFISDFKQVVQKRWSQVLKTLDKGELKAFYVVITKLRNQLKTDNS